MVILRVTLLIAGFLKTGTEEGEYGNCNYGLVDQIAALVWIRNNIGAFGGNPKAVTLFGHGTGAAFVNLLMLSPLVLQENNTILFQRAILMGGSALSDWALVNYPLKVTYQVASALNCQVDDEFAACLRRKRLDEIMSATVGNSPYNTELGPVVDSRIVPNEPRKSMTTYSDIFRRFDLIYGTTEQESIHLLGPVALTYGMLEKERDEELRRYFHSRCQMNREFCITRTLMEYSDSDAYLDEEKYGMYTSEEPDKAFKVRDALLDILSDGRTVAPLVRMGHYHANVNPNTYFYVFAHKTQSKEYLRSKTYTGEELPYVFGIPLDGPKCHFQDQYTEKEQLLSEVIMKYFTSFAYDGDPNKHRRPYFYTMTPIDWKQLDNEWPKINSEDESYLQLDIPPQVFSQYRPKEMKFWNKLFPEISNNYSISAPIWPHSTVFPLHIKPPLKEGPEPLHKKLIPAVDNVGNTTINVPSAIDNGVTTMSISIIVLSTFLLLSLMLFLGLYYKYWRIKRKRPLESASVTNKTPKAIQKTEDKTSDCNLFKMINKSREGGTYGSTKEDHIRSKLTRQMSNSTIDAHTKVRDWITQEIIHKYSPHRFSRVRRNRTSEEAENQTGQQSVNNQKPITSARPTEEFEGATKFEKPEKISVAVDATPSGRGPSVLEQQPIELMKFQKLKRSFTLEECVSINEPLKGSNNLDLILQMPEESVIKIDHSHSRSEPVQDLYSSVGKNKILHTFGDTNFQAIKDINVTSRDENMPTHPALSPEESLMTIKRRNFPKVLPDYPSREQMAIKRRSMPVVSLFENSTLPHHPNCSMRKLPPPIPPPRSSSSLTAKTSVSTQSAPMLAEEPPCILEPELSCNNLYVGPLIPKQKLNTQPIYESLKGTRRNEPKVIIKPSNLRQSNDSKTNNKYIPRVVVADNLPQIETEVGPKSKKSQIPTLVKNASQHKQPSSSSDSTPSDGSDTGTVVKRI